MTKFLSTLMVGVTLMGAASAGANAEVVVRDHRSTPVVRDHRVTSTPVVRDHRSPTPAPDVRDHRRPGIKVKVINPLKVVPNPFKVLW